MITFDLASINVHLGLDRWLQRRHLLVEELIDLSPDIIAIQEVNVAIRQGRWLRNQLNARQPDKLPYHYVQCRRRNGLFYFVEAIGILSRLPIISADHKHLSMGRVALRANIELPTGKAIDVVSVHLTSQPNAVETRDKQVMQLMSWLDRDSAVEHRMIAGSFRDIPNSQSIQRMKSFFGYRSVYESIYHREPLATWPTALNRHQQTQGVCHDYIFMSPHLGTVESAAVCCTRSDLEDPDLFASDHVGLYTSIRINR